MFSSRLSIAFSCFALSFSSELVELYGDSPSTWTGAVSSQMNEYSNWTNGVPYAGIAVFNGNGDYPPIANFDGGIYFDEIQFTAPSQIFVTAGLEASGPSGVVALPGVTATFQVCEHQPLFYPPANLSIFAGPAGDGGGKVEYDLDSYGQLYAHSGSTGATVINVTMSGGYNYFELTGSGSSFFDNVSSDSPTDQILIDSGSTLVVRGSEENTIEGIISGEGSLIKEGIGSLILNGNNTFSGGMVVSSGVLELNGTLSSSLTVNPNGFLKGSGAIHSTLVVEGTVSPGNSIGSLSVIDLQIANGGVFSCEVDSSGASDQILASGTISLDGTLDIITLDSDFSSAKTYTILEAAGGISGKFSNITSDLLALKSLQYDFDSVSLSYLPVSAIGLEGNAQKAANCYATVEGEDANKVAIELLSLSFPQMQKAFNQIQPSQVSSQAWTQISNGLLITSSYGKHLRDLSFRKECEDSDSVEFWLDPLGQWEQQGKEDNQFGYSDWTTGFSLGADSSFRKFRFGGAASYTYSNLSIDDSLGQTNINSYYGGIYGGWAADLFYVMASVLGSYNHYHGSRHLSFGDIHRHASASHHGWEMVAGIETGGEFQFNQCLLGPFIRFDYVYLWQQGYHESGAKSLNLSINSHQDQLIQSQAGFALSRAYSCDPKRVSGFFIPRLEVSYINQSPISNSKYTGYFEDSSCEVQVSGWKFERNLGAFGVSLTYLTVKENIGVSVQYDGQFGSNYVNQSGHLLLNFRY